MEFLPGRNSSECHHARYLGSTIQVLVHINMILTDAVIIIIFPQGANLERRSQIAPTAGEPTRFYLDR